MIRTLNAEKALETLATIWAEQNGQRITDIKITRRGSNEENNINSAGSSNSI